MSKYEFKAIEKKWRARWQDAPPRADDETRPAFYCLDMFPYPSGTGLHVGHWRGYVLSDVISRYKMLRGYDVLHPFGWDAFGLPAENYAIKVKKHPAVCTAENILNFKRQMTEMSTVIDWEREIDTTAPGYYKWTQWIFIQMFKKGLAYEKEMPLNWCPKCKIVKANEETAGGVCDICGTAVEKKMLRQWMLRITDYAERLLNDLDGLDWPAKVKKMQADWIGKSYGAELDFAVAGRDEKITVFTTRPDTLCGATFMVLAPEHPLAERLTTPENADAVNDYIRQAGARSSIDRMAAKEKTGVFTGSYAVNPLTGRADMPVWISDYVLIDYGTGAIMCVPAHDERDFEFAKKFNLPITIVIAGPDMRADTELTEAYTGGGVLVNSGAFDGLAADEAIEKITAYLSERGAGKKTVNYKLRDWVFSRQRYWGEPIPVIHCPKCGPVTVPEDELPVLLPEVQSYQPTDTGESPLAAMTDWVNVKCPECGGPGRRETNTMPQWAGSSWYFIRYADPKNDSALASAENIKKWLPVDFYIGGVEHAVLHCLYARFYTKFLYDIGVVDFKEPFTRLFNIGMINYHGKKMSKSAGHGVSPDDMISKYGCDALRMYELFVGPPEVDSEWGENGIEGPFRYLSKVWKLAEQYASANVKPTPEMTRLRHKLIHDITSRLESLSMNTVISGFMENTNELAALAARTGGIDRETMETLIILLAPAAPHIAEEIWEKTGHGGSVFAQKWPEYDAALLRSDTVEIALQINGKFRDSIVINAGADKETALAEAKRALAKRLEGVEIVKTIYVPGRIINYVVK